MDRARRTSTVHAAAAALALAVAAAPPAHASRVLYRCELEGRVLYTDSPCANADHVQAIKVPGAAAVERSADRADARAALAFANAVDATVDARTYGWDPLTHRFTPAEKAECPHLAQRMARVEAEERSATSATIDRIQERLAVQRSRFRELGC